MFNGIVIKLISLMTIRYLPSDIFGTDSLFPGKKRQAKESLSIWNLEMYHSMENISYMSSMGSI